VKTGKNTGTIAFRFRQVLLCVCVCVCVCVYIYIYIYNTVRYNFGPGSVGGIATGLGLDGPGIESWWGRDFPYLSIPALGPTQPLVQWVLGLSPGVKSGRCVTLTPSPTSSVIGHERVELYLYSPYRSYCLYRASVPVQRCTLPLPLTQTILYFIRLYSKTCLKRTLY